MPEQITLTTAPAVPIPSGRASKIDDSARCDGISGLSLPGTHTVTESGGVSIDLAAPQTGGAQAGGFEELLNAQLAMTDAPAADSRRRGHPASARLCCSEDDPAERTGEPDVVASVLAETAALAVTTQIPRQIASANCPGHVSMQTAHHTVMAAASSEPETGEATPVPPQVPNQATPFLRALTSDQAEISTARPKSPRADPAGTVRGQTGIANSDHLVAPARPDRIAAVPDPERAIGKPETSQPLPEPASLAARAQTDPLPERPPRIDVSPTLDSRPAATIPVVRVTHPLASPEWSREFGAQVTLFVSRKESQAEIRVNPPELGPVDVRIGFDGDKVSVAFAANPAETRQAIQDALPQLRELLAERGLSLGNTTVGAESSPREFAPAPRFAAREPSGEDLAVREQHAVRLAHRLVDTFA